MSEPEAPDRARPPRLEWLDALRGFALLGVLLVNLRALSLYDFLTAAGRAALPTARMDEWIGLAMAAFVDGKSFTLFTLLFGVGFALQTDGADAARRRRFLRRLVILLGIGLLHGAIWWGDILRHYAVLGLILLLLSRVGARTLGLLGIFVAVFATPLLRPWMQQILPATASGATASAAALAGFSGEAWGAAWRANFDYDLWVRVSAWGLPFYVLGRLLVGAAIGRSAALRDPLGQARFWNALLLVTLPLGLAATAIVLLRDHGWTALASPWWSTEIGRGSLRALRSTASLALGVAYFAGFVRLFTATRVRGALSLLAPVGRMALTNYLLQTLVGLAVFYGIGGGVGPRFGLVGVVLGGGLLFAAQIFASRWWLQHFHFGPAEWVWRGLTHGRWPAFQRSLAA